MPSETFRQRFLITVPARGLTGGSPKREQTFSFVLPAPITLHRIGAFEGASVVDENFGGLTEVRREFRPVANGVEFTWELKNNHVTPITGRSAFLELELTGERTPTRRLSDKYLELRRRFLERFYFAGRVAEWVDPGVTGGAVKFGDQTIYLGFALMVFATEAAILRDAGGDVGPTLTVIGELLDAFDALDRAGEMQFGLSEALDGFFVRDDITGPADPKLGARFAACDSDFQEPELENATPSGDQIFGLMGGLWAVVRLAGESGLAARAQGASSRLYDYAQRCHFVLSRPDGQPTRRGSDMRWLASLLHGLNRAITGVDLFAASSIRVAGVDLSLNPIAAFWDDHATADRIEQLAGQTLHIPIIDEDLALNAFALHLLLMALAPASVWSQAEIEAVAVKVNHHASILLHCVAFAPRLPLRVAHEEVTRILEACPASGPSAALDVVTGWHKDNRWIRSANLADPSGGGTREFNGLDWLLLHNLDQLVFA